MRERILGLDIGIASIGWAVVDYDKENYLNNKIIKSGVRIFTIAENPKTGESLALPRRLSRGSRKVLKRKAQRIKAIKKLFINYLNLSEEEFFSKDSIYNSKDKKIDVWQLRDKALKRILTDIEFARVLTHIAKRRGYKSNRKVDELGNSEGKKVLSAIEKNKELLNGYSTIGQAIYQTTKATHKRRNKKDNYSLCISRDMLKKEIDTIFDRQKELGNQSVNETFKKEYLKLFLKQKDFASVEDMVGYCTLEGCGEKRAPKASYSAGEFITLTKLINTKIVDSEGKERSLSNVELEKAIELCKQSEQPTYIKLKEYIGLDYSEYFKGVEFYEVDKRTGEITNKATKFISGFTGFHKLRGKVEKVLSKTHWQNISINKELLDDISKIFSYHKSDDKINEELQKLSFNPFSEDEKQIVIQTLIENISFDKFLNISLKAINKLLVYMRDGKRYDEALAFVGYKKELQKKEKFLRVLNKDEQLELTNPVVKRALSQSRKVINALIRRYGQFDKIHIELTRDIKKSHQDRNKIKKAQDEYQVEKKGIVEHFIQSYGKEPKGNELLKFRLWKEQDGYCAYSGYKGQEGYIQPERILEHGYVEIDHILPFSRSLEDGMFNKVLCLAKENQDKKNRTPYEYFSDMRRDWSEYEVFIKNMKNIKKAKRNRLLKKNFDENSEKEFRDRNANDTAFMARFIKNFIEDNLELLSEDKLKVLTRNGMLTNILRHHWQVGNKSRDNHLHHAVDAIIIAFATQSEVQRLSTLSAKKDGFIYEKSEKKSRQLDFIPPLENFRDEVQKSLDDIFVSFAPRRGVTGAAHKETIYSKNMEKQKGIFEVNNGLAENGEVKRVDVFKKDEKYHFIFLYPSDFLKNELPNTTIKGIKIDDSFEFVFSLFKDEYIEIKQKDKEPFEGYLKFVEGDGRFNILPHFQAELDKKANRFSTGSLEFIKKFQVDPLGNKYEIKQEKRLGTKKSR